MTDILLLKRNVPIKIIQQKVSEVTEIPIDLMLVPDRIPGARKREYITARQISMTIAKNKTKLSLSNIGFLHGGRDHATVLHASKTVSNLIESKDLLMCKLYYECEKKVNEWEKNTNDARQKLIPDFRREIVKLMISFSIPLNLKQQILNIYDRYKLETVSTAVQNCDQKEL